MLAEVKLRNALKTKQKNLNKKLIVCIGVSTPSKNTAPPPPSFLPSPPPLNQQTVQASPFLENPPLYIGFSWPPLKSDLSVNPQNIKVYHP